MMTLSDKELLIAAQELRAHVRAHASLGPDWEQASASMRAWYIMLVRRVRELPTQ